MTIEEAARALLAVEDELRPSGPGLSTEEVSDWWERHDIRWMNALDALRASLSGDAELMRIAQAMQTGSRGFRLTDVSPPIPKGPPTA